jgi:hypothetical protein
VPCKRATEKVQSLHTRRKDTGVRGLGKKKQCFSLCGVLTSRQQANTGGGGHDTRRGVHHGRNFPRGGASMRGTSAGSDSDCSRSASLNQPERGRGQWCPPRGGGPGRGRGRGMGRGGQPLSSSYAPPGGLQPSAGFNTSGTERRRPQAMGGAAMPRGPTPAQSGRPSFRYWQPQQNVLLNAFATGATVTELLAGDLTDLQKLADPTWPNTV